MAIDKSTVTLGNLLSIGTTLVSIVGGAVMVTNALANLRADAVADVNAVRLELRTEIAQEKARVAQIEATQRQTSIDHDILIEIRQDMRQVKSALGKSGASFSP